MAAKQAWRETGVADMFLETSPFVPVLLIVQPGCDPTADLQVYLRECINLYLSVNDYYTAG